MDYFTILAQRKRLHDTYAGHRLATVRLFGRHLYLGFGAPRAMKLACIPDMPYLSEPEDRFIPVKRSRDWHAGLLRGAILESVEIVPGDRILTFPFSGGHRLIFEMTGRHANIILTGDDGIIIGALRTVTGAASGVRRIQRGVAYQPPPPRPDIDPVWTSPPVLIRLLQSADGPAADALANTLYSGSRLFAREALARAGIDSGIPIDRLDNVQFSAMFRATAVLASGIENGGEGGTVIIGPNGLPRDVFPLPMRSAGPDDRHFGDLNEAIEHYAREREHGLELWSLRRSVAASLKRDEKSLVRTRGKVERERGDDGEPERLDRLGNTILANIGRIGRGVSEATLPDIYEGGEITIELDPSLDAPANAERLFARARKLRAAAGMADRRLADIDRRIGDIRRRREQLDGMHDIKELRALESSLSRRASRDHDNGIDQPFPRRFTTRSGLEIVVGRNDRENDALVRWAGRNDTWLHAQGVGGSHVILRHGKQPPDRHSLEQAAAIAAYYSKAKTSGIVPVAHTAVKYVVKRKGQGPGQVTYTREKVIFAEPGLPGRQDSP